MNRVRAAVVGPLASDMAWKVVASVLASVLTVSLIVALLGARPMEVFAAFLDGSMGADSSRGQTVMIASILALTGLAAAVPFRASMFNVGAEGQLYLGAIAATWTGLTLGDHVRRAILVPLLLVLGAAAGAAWAALPGVLRAYRGTNEVIVSLMLTFIAILAAELVTTEYWSSGLTLTSRPLPDAALLPMLSSSMRITLGAALALAIVGASWVVMMRSALGFQIRAAGFNAETSSLSGLAVRRLQAGSFVIGGACAGLAGAIMVSGMHGGLIAGGAAGLGFLGIAVALVARLEPAGIAPAAVLFASLRVGSNALQVRAGVSSATGEVLVGIFVIALLAFGAIRLGQEQTQ
jgi:ABC-type uncharacterized transport system permease subunit